MRDHAKRRQAARLSGQAPEAVQLRAIGFLLAVDDASRAGALRFQDEAGVFCRATEPGRRTAANLADQLLIMGSGAVTVIAPSRWMAQCARRSAVFSGSRIEIIPYGIDTERFQAVPQGEARNRLHLPADNLLLLFGVDNAREKRKGLRELFGVLEACGETQVFRQAAAQEKAELLCFGDLDWTPELPLPVTRFGRIRSDDVLNSLYSAADLFLLPSIEDNLPNTVLESMCCGTPVGGFSTGGVPDMVIQGKTGFLVPTGDVEGLGQIIVNGALNRSVLREMRPVCRRRVEEHYTYQRQAEACVALYDDLLRGSKTLASAQPHTGASLETQEAGPHFQRIFPQLLQQVFEASHNVMPILSASRSDQNEAVRRARFARRVKKILRLAVRRAWPYARLRTVLDGEFDILGGKSAWPIRAKLFLKLMWRIPWF